ncbi:MAG TPA: NADH-quinone oxidoreductase subunit N [Terriglobales bacterium]|jgi:NADH-quinone oxidoreductase subunit N
MIPQLTSADYIRLLPELILIVFGTVVMMAEAFVDQQSDRKSLGVIALIGAVLSIFASFYQAGHMGLGFVGMIRVDSFSIFFHVLIGIITAVVILASFEYLKVQQIKYGEYYGLILLGAVGQMLMSSAVELVLIFIALEISSIATYILAGFRRRVAISIESSVKYFLLGSFATAFFLYGIALIFGATGSTSVYTIAGVLQNGATPLAYAGVAMMFVGLGFKIAAAPFHVWTPDVYEGAPSPVVALMSTGPKAAAFAVLLRVLFATSAPSWFWLVWVSAVLSMTIGNIGALVQQNVKRLLAYSSIAHAGYLLVAFAAAKDFGISAAIFYTASYAAMNVGAFAVVSHLANVGEKYVTLDDYAGLGRRAPAQAAILTLFMLSLIGIPITGGFLAKFYVFQAAMQSHLTGLVIIGVINSAIAAYYYLRVIVVMYMNEPTKEVPVLRMPAGLTVALVTCVIATIYLGVLPDRVLEYALQSARELVR